MIADNADPHSIIVRLWLATAIGFPKPQSLTFIRHAMPPVHRSSRWLALILLGLLVPPLQPRPLTAAPSLQGFAAWCQNLTQLQPSQRYTIAAMLNAARTADCAQAEQVLLANPGLDLQGQGIQDLSPLTTLPHLSNLNLTHNSITDLSPLRQLPHLTFLLAGRNHIETVTPLAQLSRLSYVVLEHNQIKDVSALAKLQNLTALNLIENPITQKTCPVAPAHVCQFSDRGQDQLAMAEHQYQQGQFQLALQSFQQVLHTYEQDGDRHKQGDVLNRLGDIHLQLGQYPQALHIYGQALNLRRSIMDESGIVVSLTSLASAYERLGVYDQAQAVLQTALTALQQQNPFRLDGGGIYEQAKEEALLYGWQARIFNQQGQSQQALVALEKAQFLFDQLPPAFPHKRFDERLLLETKGVAMLAFGQRQSAIATWQQALQVAVEIRDRKGQATTLSLLGRAYRQLGKTNLAITTFRQALAIQQEIDDQPGAGLTLHHLGETLLHRQADAEATTALRQAIDIWDDLRPGLTDTHQVSIFETQAQTYALLQAALVAQQRPEAALEIAERGRARAFAAGLTTRLGDRTSASPPTIDAIRQIARTQQATLVEYSLLPEQLLIWVVTPTGQVSLRTVARSKLAHDLPSLIQDARQAMGVTDRGLAVVRKQPRPLAQALQHLHHVLIEPIADLLPEDPADRVIVIPHQELFLVPFPALMGATGPLIQNHTLLSAPSIQLLELTHQQQKQPVEQPSHLVVGNPEMPQIAGGWHQAAQTLPPLPGAEQEAHAIATLLNTQALTGPAATESVVTAQMAQAHTIHLATHGLLDELNHLGLTPPGAIALTPSPQSTASGTDGLLTAAEILNLKLKADLVVLSACNTGVGTITGDGVIGLSRSLMVAGAPSVVVSLWSVPDAPTAILMTEFYRQLQQNPDKAQALRQAMLKTQQQHPDPKNWAAFTLMGQAR